MSYQLLVPNPAYAGRKPTPLKAECHDRSPFITVVCGCGNEMHLHETQLDPAHDGAEIAVPCRRCGEFLVFPPMWFREAFKRMREEGWIA